MDNFKLHDVISDIGSLDQTHQYERNIELFLIRVTKLENELYKQQSDDGTKRVVFASIKEQLNKTQFRDREITSYDIVNTKKNTHELVTVAKFDNIKNVLDSFDDESSHLTSTSGLSEKKFQLYMISLKTQNHNYKIIGNFSNILELKKKFLLGNFTNSKINLTDHNDIFGFSKKIELLIVDNEFVLINQAESKFESLFKMNALFSAQAENILKNNNQIQQIFSDETRNKLIEKVKSGKRMATRLIKITENSERFSKTVEHIDKLNFIISNPHHSFHNQVSEVVLDNGQISAPEGKEIQLLNAISDAFYQAFISETENVDPSRM